MRALPSVVLLLTPLPRVERMLQQRGDWAAAGGYDAVTTTAILCSAVGMLQPMPRPAKAAEADDGAAFR